MNTATGAKYESIEEFLENSKTGDLVTVKTNETHDYHGRPVKGFEEDRFMKPFVFTGALRKYTKNGNLAKDEEISVIDCFSLVRQKSFQDFGKKEYNIILEIRDKNFEVLYKKKVN